MKNLMIALKTFLVLTILAGLIYPLAVTGFAQVVFTNKANGSMIIKDNCIIGSELIGQQFTRPEYFWGRPSAINCNPLPSGASNLNPVGNMLKGQILARVDTLRKYHGDVPINDIPKDLLFASGSGVDPHLSPEAVYFQLDRIAQYRHLTEEQISKLRKIIELSIESPDLLILGERRINVLELNLKLLELSNGNTR